MSDPDTKTCPVCKKKFTRKQLGFSKMQWVKRIYCSMNCMKRDPQKKRWGNR